MDRSSVFVLAHIEFKPAVVVVFVLHLELESECLPLSLKIDRRVFEIADPAGVRRGYSDDAFSGFVGTDIEGYFIFVALEHRKIRMNELHRIFLGTIVLCVDDHLAILDLC